MAGLARDDFEVYLDAKPQQITAFNFISATPVASAASGTPAYGNSSSSNAPSALVVAIQASGISKAVLEKVQSIGVMIQPLVTGERGCAAVMSFSEPIVWIQECTNSDDALARAFEQVHPGEAKSACLLDAVHQSIEHLRQRPNSRRVLLLISESRDRSSDTALDQAAVAAQAAGVTVYAATFSAFKTGFTSKSSATDERQPPRHPHTPMDENNTVSGQAPRCNPQACVDPPLPPPEQRVDILASKASTASIGELVRLGKTNTTEGLTKGTGGATFPFTRLKGLEKAIQKLGAELHSQYLLSFTPGDSEGGYHRLEVRVAGGDFRVRAHPGYWSTQASGQ